MFVVLQVPFLRALLATHTALALIKVGWLVGGEGGGFLKWIANFSLCGDFLGEVSSP